MALHFVVDIGRFFFETQKHANLNTSKRAAGFVAGALTHM